MADVKLELYRDNFQNYKSYGIPKAQLVIADIPYNIGENAYGSSPEWYIGGDNKNGESAKAKKTFFNTDVNFNLAEYMHFCSKLLVKEPKETGKAPAMIVFCAFEQLQMLIDYGKRYGFPKYQHLTFIKNYSPQVLKANMRICGATEHAIVLYRDKLPKFNNNGKMVFDWINWGKDSSVPKVHPTQKPIPVLKKLIALFTDPGEVVIDPCAGSGTTLLAAYDLGRHSYGFEIDRNFHKEATRLINEYRSQIRWEV